MNTLPNNIIKFLKESDNFIRDCKYKQEQIANNEITIQEADLDPLGLMGEMSKDQALYFLESNISAYRRDMIDALSGHILGDPDASINNILDMPLQD